MDSDLPGSGLAPITEERRIRAAPRSLWSLCTTADGLTKWWAPEGLVLTVSALEIRVGGRIDLLYQESGAVHDPEWAAQLRARGQATEFVARGRFTEVVPLERLAFSQELDFGRAGHPQEYRATAVFHLEAPHTRVQLTTASPPSKHWTLLGRANVRAQLERLAQAAEASGPDG